MMCMSVCMRAAVRSKSTCRCTSTRRVHCQRGEGSSLPFRVIFDIMAYTYLWGIGTSAYMGRIAFWAVALPGRTTHILRLSSRTLLQISLNSISPTSHFDDSEETASSLESTRVLQPSSCLSAEYLGHLGSHRTAFAAEHTERSQGGTDCHAHEGFGRPGQQVTTTHLPSRLAMVRHAAHAAQRRTRNTHRHAHPLMDVAKAEVCLQAIRRIHVGREDQAAEMLQEVPLLARIVDESGVEAPALLRQLAEFLQTAALHVIRDVAKSSAPDLHKTATHPAKIDARPSVEAQGAPRGLAFGRRRDA